MQAPGFAIWLTGLPASGKTTLAQALAEVLKTRDVPVQLLDSDEVRTALTPEPTYSQAERDQFYRSLAYMGHLLARNGVNVIIAATAHRQQYRDAARESIKAFYEVYLQCSLATCRERDPKGIYARAEAGDITRVPGIQVPYEAPVAPELVLDCEARTVEESVRQLLALLQAENQIPSL